jgi:hypothetical protein
MRRVRAFARFRGMLCALVCLLICVVCGTASAQSFSTSAANPVVSQLLPLTDADNDTDTIDALPVELATSKPLEATPGEAQPGEVGFVPLRVQDRAALFYKGYLASPVSYIAIATSASAGWAAGEPEGWGRTFRGYGQRVGTEVVLYSAEEAVRDVGDAALGLDPRYFPCRCSSFWHRSRNALAMTVLAYDDSGKLHLDLPRFLGDYGGSMLVSTWYPAGYSPLAQGVRMGHVQIGLDAGVNLLREFSPDIKRFFHVFKTSKTP